MAFLFSMALMHERLRGVLTLLLFVAFDVGALVLAPFMLLLRQPRFAQPVVRAFWRPMAFLYGAFQLVHVERGNLDNLRGTILAANHPSLIDVVLVTVLLPRTLYVAKESLRHSFFLGWIVRATSLPVNGQLPEVAAPYLEKGWNLLIFPEGTRTPLSGERLPFHRGAAQVALRTHAPLRPLHIALTRRILAHGQSIWDMGKSCVTYTFRVGDEVSAELHPGETVRDAARRITAELEDLLR